jgi:phospholipid/cholesterol/gamma-HCH transport system permease protein
MQVDFHQNRETLIAALSGDWEMDRPTPRFEELVASHNTNGAVERIGFDTSALGVWDSSLLAFLVQGRHYCEARNLDFDEESLPKEIKSLLQLARAVPEQLMEPPAPPAPLVTRVGATMISAVGGMNDAITFIGEVARGAFRILLFRTKMRWRDFWVVVQTNGSKALPIVTLISFLVGLIIAFLGAVVLKRFGAGYYVSYLVGYGMLREMAALMTGIIMAGRTGAAFAAEIGSMKLTEEIDAYRTLGLSPIDYLVMPRVLGLFVMMPLLTIYATFIGVAGGLLVSVLMLDLTPTQFIGGLLTPIVLSDGLLGIFKGTVYGLIIGMAGCMRGLQAGNDASAVGRAATSAVVTGITLIILANAVIDMVAALIGV